MPILSYLPTGSGRGPSIPTSPSAPSAPGWPNASGEGERRLDDEKLPPPLFDGLDVALDERALTFITSTTTLIDQAVADLRQVLREDVCPVAEWTAGPNPRPDSPYWWVPSRSSRTAGVTKAVALSTDLVELEKRLRAPVADLAAVLALVGQLHSAVADRSRSGR